MKMPNQVILRNEMAFFGSKTLFIPRIG